MKIIKSRVTSPQGNLLNARIEGRIDASNARQLIDEIAGDLKKVKVLNLDFTAVDYISSVGIRSLLVLYKQMRRQNGNMEISNVNNEVMEVFKIIGLTQFVKTV